eukprot:TRINITY_DN57120_c0_g1_i1.p1 TRINITY_DN57120_c0_g1~~TRINITY_DN57120_c0_g1_i1.p1  ORF type:complete len:178 (+),score=15.22 TRINITY_DN57120_c0_g1_i1:131-664(+)
MIRVLRSVCQFKRCNLLCNECLHVPSISPDRFMFSLILSVQLATSFAAAEDSTNSTSGEEVTEKNRSEYAGPDTTQLILGTVIIFLLCAVCCFCTCCLCMCYRILSNGVPESQRPAFESALREMQAKGYLPRFEQESYVVGEYKPQGIVVGSLESSSKDSPKKATVYECDDKMATCY